MVSMDSKGDVSEESCLGLDLHDAIMNRIIIRTRISIIMQIEKLKEMNNKSRYVLCDTIIKEWESEWKW